MKTMIYVSSSRNHVNILFKLYNQMQGVKKTKSYFWLMEIIKRFMHPPQGTVTSFSQNFKGISTMYQSIPILTIPPPPGFAGSHCPEGRGFSANFLSLGGRGFELEKFSIVRKEKCRNFSICFKKSKAA